MAMRTRYRWVALLIAGLQFAPAALCQGKQGKLQKPSAARPVPLIIEKGVPLQISLEKAIPVKHEGIPVRGRLVKPIYVFNQMVIPAGSQVLGSVSRVDRVSRARRLEAIANGNFTPLRTAHLKFDTVILNDGRRIPVKTVVSQGAPNVVHLSAGSSGKKKGRLREKVAQAREEVKARERQGLEDVRSPGKLKRIEAALATELPYHRQFLPVGTQFTAVLQTPLEMGSERMLSKDLTRLGGEIDPGSVVHVRLLTSLSSATDRRGAIVEAVVSQPAYSTDHQLILPQGTQLQGRVTEAAPARHFGRNGRLRFTFRQIDLPGVAPRQVVATLQGVDARSSAHLKVDTEGGVRAVTPRTRYIAPAIDVVLATSSLDGLDPHRRLHPHFTQGPDVAGGFIRGGAGLGLVGSVVGITAHYRPVSAVFAFYAAGWSVYSHLIVRGTDVVFPVNTPMEILFGK
ncbi:MAG TPA: hypothetical protein VGY31_11250, partial [Terriglobia bacterium]|nr:hypothetical protein [Terriglobia bacterium]